jgi:hypothetical protein
MLQCQGSCRPPLLRNGLFYFVYLVFLSILCSILLLILRSRLFCTIMLAHSTLLFPSLFYSVLLILSASGFFSYRVLPYYRGPQIQGTMSPGWLNLLR